VTNFMKLVFALSDILRVSYPQLNALHEAAAVDHPLAAAPHTAAVPHDGENAADSPRAASASNPAGT
jgi:hypothetical protein